MRKLHINERDLTKHDYECQSDEMLNQLIEMADYLEEMFGHRNEFMMAAQVKAWRLGFDLERMHREHVRDSAFDRVQAAHGNMDEKYIGEDDGFCGDRCRDKYEGEGCPECGERLAWDDEFFRDYCPNTRCRWPHVRKIA
jgi:hypothetical protein